MRPLHLTLLFGIGLFMGCQGSPKEMPVKGEELIDLLVDIHVAEAAIQDLYGQTKDSVGRVYYQQVFHMHEIDSAIFDTTMAVLRRNPDYASRVYQQVMRVIEEKQAETE